MSLGRFLPNFHHFRQLHVRSGVKIWVARYEPQIVDFVGAWTDNHRSVWFIFGSESSSAYRLLGITHSFKVTRKRLKCLESAFQAIHFSKFFIFWGSALWASCLRCLRANRRSTNFNPVLSGKHARAPPPKNEIDFTLYTYAIQA